MTVDLRLPTDRAFRFAAMMGTPRADSSKAEDVGFDLSKTLLIGRSEGGITTPLAERPFLATGAPVDGGMVVVAYNPFTKVTGMLHLERPSTGRSDESLLSRILKRTQALSDTSLEIRIVGPHHNGQAATDFLDRVADRLEKAGAVIVSVDSNGKPAPHYFAVNSAQWDKGLIHLSGEQEYPLNGNATLSLGDAYARRKTAGEGMRFADGNILVYDGEEHQGSTLGAAL